MNNRLSHWYLSGSENPGANHVCMSQQECGVLAESLISPSGTVRGLLEKSPLYEDYTRSPSGLIGESLESGRTSAILGLVHMHSLGTPGKLLGGSRDSMGTLRGLPINVWLSVMTSETQMSC